jgi:hypothetical protein
MEALVILLAELLGAPVIATLVFFATFAILLFSLSLELLRRAFPRGGDGDEARGGQYPDRRFALRRTRSRILGWMRASAFATLALMVAALLAANFIFLDLLAKRVLAAAGRHTNTEIAFTSIAGNIFTGEFTLTGVKAKRETTVKSSFDLAARRLTADLDLWSLLVRPIAFEAVTVEGVTGSIRSPERRKRSGASGDVKLKPKRKFLIRGLALSDVAIALSKGENAPVAIALNSVKTTGFRSNFAVFDTLFRSDLSGTLDGRELVIATEPAGIGRITRWRIPDLAADTLSRIVTRPPAGWLREGTLNVSVDDRLQLNDRDEIHMDWRVRMQGVRAEARADAGLIEKTMAAPVAGYIKAKDGNLDLNFTLVVNEPEFENMSSIDAGVLWSVISRSMAETMGLGGGEEEPAPAETSRTSKAIDAVKRLLRGKRKEADAE